MPSFDFASFFHRYVRACETSESPIEHLFQMVLERYLHPNAQLIPQHEYTTRRGNFRADFMLVTANGERLILECDGRDYHDPVRDAFRDAFTLASQCANFVYRFNGSTINGPIWHALYALYRHHDDVFSIDGEHDIRDKASRFVEASELHPSARPRIPESFPINPRESHGAITAPVSWIEVRCGINNRGARLFGRDLIDIAREHPGEDIDALTGRMKTYLAELEASRAKRTSSYNGQLG